MSRDVFLQDPTTKLFETDSISSLRFSQDEAHHFYMKCSLKDRDQSKTRKFVSSKQGYLSETSCSILLEASRGCSSIYGEAVEAGEAVYSLGWLF